MTTSAFDSTTQQTLRSVAIDCLRSPNDEEAAERARVALSDPTFNWLAFQSFSHQERIAPLIYYYGSSGILPPQQTSGFQRAYLQSAWDNTLRLDELNMLLDRFESAGIQATLLKGMTFLINIYDKVALRPMGDVDILVPAEDVDRADKIIVSSGYKIFPNHVNRDFSIEIDYYKEANPFLILELHWSLLGTPNILTQAQLEWFLDHRTFYKKGGLTIQTFDPTAQLLYLSAHMWLDHNGGYLLWENDLYQYVRKYFSLIDWDELITISHDFCLLIPLRNVLLKLSGSWDVPIPKPILERITAISPFPTELRKFGETWDNDDQNYLSVLYDLSMSFPDWTSRIQYACKSIFPPTTEIRARYNPHGPIQLVFFYFYRLFARAIQQIKRAIAKLRSPKTP